jgi:DNA-binding transcriptional MerR regulator
MIKIGDFSKLSLVSIKTLRYYDEMGLLKPVNVDRFTGYRYYSASQLPRLNRILALKDLGFSLEQIAQVLNEGVSLEQLRGMLRLKQAELQQHITGEQERLARISARLNDITMEGRLAVAEKVSLYLYDLYFSLMFQHLGLTHGVAIFHGDTSATDLRNVSIAQSR